jgi:hypothetical protein
MRMIWGSTRSILIAVDLIALGLVCKIEPAAAAQINIVVLGASNTAKAFRAPGPSRHSCKRY